MILNYFFRHDDKYQFNIVMRDPKGKTREAGFVKSFANFIDINGTVVQSIVTNEITKIYNSLSSEKKEK